MNRQKLIGLIGAPIFLIFLGFVAYYIDGTLALVIFLIGLFLQHRSFQKRNS